MEVDTGVFLFYALFQFGGASLLALQRLEGMRGPPLVLAALLALNAILTSWSFLASVGAPLTTSDTIYQAIDAPTGALLLAYVALRHRRVAWAGASVALGAATSAAILFVPGSLAGGTLAHGILVTDVYYLGLAATVLVSSRGRALDQWVVVAFAPRGLLFATQAASSISHGIGIGGVQLLAVLLGVACLAAFWRIARNPLPAGPSVTVILALAAVGPVDAIAFNYVDTTTPRGGFASAILNYVTLSFVRPLFLYVAFTPSEAPRLLARALFGAGVGTALVALGPFMGFTGAGVGMLALSTGSILLAADEARRNRTASVPIVEADRRAGGRPHWQTLLLTLEGAGAREGDAPPKVAWTQRGLAEATGIGVQRVSEFAREMNEFAEDRLDAFVPSWREGRATGGPVVLTRHVGAVEGLRGVRVYYRLTPLGIRLAEAVRSQPPLNVVP